ncbi:MazG-like family protein [Streptomyces sp. NPDC001233]|uniref:MazG-like family protein n=1 Tax=Streptomyces sp. NPDC002589 TaxID=3154420 RepID=UPI00332A764C
MSMWDQIAGIVAWIDEQSPTDEKTALLMRTMKITEEVGEVNQAVIGALAYNPRKGASHTMDDVKKELCDVILTAAVALRTIDKDAEQTFAQNLTRVAERSKGRADG